jgi:hypothetical protein
MVKMAGTKRNMFMDSLKIWKRKVTAGRENDSAMLPVNYHNHDMIEAPGEVVHRVTFNASTSV